MIFYLASRFTKSFSKPKREEQSTIKAIRQSNPKDKPEHSQEGCEG